MQGPPDPSLGVGRLSPSARPSAALPFVRPGGLRASRTSGGLRGARRFAARNELPRSLEVLWRGAGLTDDEQSDGQKPDGQQPKLAATHQNRPELEKLTLASPLGIAHGLMLHNRCRRAWFRLVGSFCCSLGVAALLSSVVGALLAAPASGPPDLSALDAIIERAIAVDEIPGAVLLVSHRGRVIHRKAYGSRALLPKREPMTLNTIFDVASLTKGVATTSSVMKLVEQGKLRLNDPLSRYIPEFTGNGKEQVTLRQLLTHTSGLRPIPRLLEKWSGTDAVLKSIYDDILVAPPGARFLYSDGNFILLGELVRRASGVPLDEFFAREIAAPLGLRHTRFLPPAGWSPRIAPTEEVDLPSGAKAGSGDRKRHV